MEESVTTQNFNCDRYCGECCKKLLVQVSKTDIKCIEALGFNKDQFLMHDYFRPKRLLLKKDEKGWCVFLKKSKEGIYSCKIYEDRPQTCKRYPFFNKKKRIKSCLPHVLYPNVFFNFSKKSL